MTHSGVRYAFFGVVLLDVYPTFGGRCLQFLTTQKLHTLPFLRWEMAMWGLSSLLEMSKAYRVLVLHGKSPEVESTLPTIFTTCPCVCARKQTFSTLRVADLSSHPRYFEDGCFKLEWDTLPTFLQMRGAENNFPPRRSKYDLWSVAVPIFYTTPVARSIEARIGVFHGTVSRMLCPPYIFLTRVYVHVPAFTHSGQCESYLSSGMLDYEPP